MIILKQKGNTQHIIKKLKTMESYLVDEKVLGEIVDAFIKEKYPDQPIKNYDSIRKDAIKSLDHQILKAVLGSLTKEQGAELDHILNSPHDVSTLEDFFKKHNIDLQTTINDAMNSFKTEFLKGGKNE